MMQRRNGPMIRVVVVVAAIGAILYLVYLNHDVNTRLKNTDDRAEKYRRSHESLSAQLQDIHAAKDELEKQSQKDRDEMTNRLIAKGKENKMIKSQHDDLKTEHEKLGEDLVRLQADSANVKAEHTREYQEMKTRKEFEITSLKDTIANIRKETEKLRSDLELCNTQNRNIQAAHAQTQQIMATLRLENQRLKDAQQNQLLRQQQQQQLLQQQQQAGVQGAAYPPLLYQGQGQAQQNQHGQLVQQQQPVDGAAMMQNNAAGGNALGQGQAGVQGINQAGGGAINPQVPEVMDQQNLQIQPARAVADQPVGYQHGEDGGGHKVGALEDNNIPEHKQEEEQQHQVQPPDLHRNDDGGLNQPNKQDHGDQADDKLHGKFGVEDKNDQLEHDNSIHNQGPVHLQVQEPLLKHNEVKRDAHQPNEDDAEAKWRKANLQEEDDQEEEQLAQPKLDHFMQNAHPNKIFQAGQPVNMDQDQPDQAESQHRNARRQEP